MKRLFISLTVLMVACFSLSSCLKGDNTPVAGFDVQKIGANSTILLETPLDVYLQADRAIRFQRDSIISKNANGASLTFKMGYISLTVSPADTTTYPKTILLDFGTDVANPYQGKMSIIMSGNMRNDKSTCAISYLNLVANGSTITGNDSIISSGKNTSGSIVSHFIMHGGVLKGYNNVNINYAGNLFGKYNLTSNTNVIDSVQINATDADMVAYKLYSIPIYKLQITKGCNFFNAGVIYSDLTIAGVPTGTIVFDYGYSSIGDTNGCDADGVVYISSKINPKYNQQLGFYAMQFK